MSVQLFENQDYTENKAYWIKWRDLYNGDHKVLTESFEYLWPHYIEEFGKDGARLLRARRRRTRYLEIPEIVISLWTSYFFRQAPTISVETDDLLGEFKENIDGKKTPLDAFAIKATESFLQSGKVFILVDAPSEGSEKIPYMQLVHALDVPDWELETDDPLRRGKFNLFRREYLQTQKRENLTQQPKTLKISDEYFRENGKVVINRYSMPTSSEKTNFHTKSEWQFKERIEIGLPEIPVAMIEDQSWIKGVCEETLRYFNLRSARDNIQHQQGYNLIFIIGGDGSDSGQIQGISEHTWPLLAAGSSVVTVPPVSTASYDASIDEALSSAFRVGLNQLRQVASDSKAVQSADSISEEKDERLALVEATTSMIQSLMNQALLFYAEFRGEQNFVPSFDLSQEFDEANFELFSKVFLTFRDQFKANPILERKAFEKAISKVFSESELEEMEDEGLAIADAPAKIVNSFFAGALEEEETEEEAEPGNEPNEPG